MSKNIDQRFWSKVDIRSESECWLWKASETNKGYGQFRYKGIVDKAHRVAYILNNGDIPDGMWVLHTCDNRLCCNPRHLRLGDPQDNVSESVSKERASHAVADTGSELRSPFQFTIEPGPYERQAFKWERRADMRLRNSDTVVFGGYGLKLCVRDGSLSVEYQRTADLKVMLFNRGVHKIKTIICYTHGGFVTLEAIEWLCQQNITMYLLNWRGELLQVFSPRQNRSAKLAYFQYKAYETDLALNIACELVYRKVIRQSQVLRRLADQPVWERFETVGDELSRVKDVETLRMLEAGYAASYWSFFTGIPIKWEYRDIKHIPEHWYSISTRVSDISKYNNASQATNPFHATLNFAYALLEAQVLEAINVAGLAPECGYLHTSEDGANSLAWDLMECFRPTIDTIILDMFAKTTFHKGDFIQWLSGECRLNDELKRYVLAVCRIDDKSIDLQCRWLRNLLESQ